MLTKRDSKTYVYVLSDGTFRVNVDEGTPNAVRREYETSTGEKGIKHELVYDELSGKITNVFFRDTDYGKQMTLKVEDGENAVYLNLNTAHNFAEDVMKKLPNVDITKDVKLVPYSFEDGNGKVKKGITIYQNKEKVQNFFYDPDAKAIMNGFPEPEGDVKKYDSDSWKVYFIGARKFLIEYTEKNCPVYNKEQEEPEEESVVENEDADISPEAIPF